MLCKLVMTFSYNIELFYIEFFFFSLFSIFNFLFFFNFFLFFWNLIFFFFYITIMWKVQGFLFIYTVIVVERILLEILSNNCYQLEIANFSTWYVSVKEDNSLKFTRFQNPFFLSDVLYA
jgi:hypothetical protein